MQWPQLFLCLALALSLQPALALLSPKGCLSRSSQRQQPSHRLARHCRSSSSGSLRARPTRRIPLALAAQQQPQHRRHQHHPCTLAQSTTAAAAASLGSFSSSDVSQRRRSARQRAAWSSTALALAAGRGVPGEAGDGAEGGQGKDGWRQRMVRTVVSVFLRMKAVVAAVGARLGLGGSSKAGRASNRSLFRGVGSKRNSRQTAGGKQSRGRLVLSRLLTKKTGLLLAIFAVAIAARFVSTRIPTMTEVPMSTFMQVMEGKRGKVSLDGVRVARSGKLFYRMDGKVCYTQPLRVSKEVFKAMTKSGVAFSASKAPPAAARTLSGIFPILYILAIYFFVLKKGQQDMVGSTGKLASSSDLDRSLTFGDVAGVDQAKSQVQELVSMIQNPEPFIAAGARLPSGLLMVGPPGTGKTLMARVMASEAGVPFYYCSGSDFVEMYVGRGAARVRKLFVKAAKTAPCIVFLDELDALGKERSSGGGGGRQTNDEAEQTLNQLLACMDGLDTNNNGVMVIAATNRFEVLDNALTRPGRFDRIVRVDVPDATGREAILKVHTRKMKLADSADLRAVAEITPGLAGAELATIANEAAISAARRGSQTLLQTDFFGSVQNFYVSRKKGAAGLQNMLKGMLN